MSKIARKISINSTVGRVYDLVTSPENWTKYVTSLVDVRDISSMDVKPGTTFRWTYRMLGMNFNGKGQVIENIKNRKFVMKMEGSFPIVETYTFAADGNSTELSVEIEYEMPGRILGVIANKGLMEKMNRKEAETVLGKIKLLCEAL